MFAGTVCDPAKDSTDIGTAKRALEAKDVRSSVQREVRGRYAGIACGLRSGKATWDGTQSSTRRREFRLAALESIKGGGVVG